MRLRLRSWSAIILMTAALSGCAEAPSAGEEAAPASTSSMTFAPRPTVDDASGSVTGLVVDEESVPVVGAQASVAEANLTVTTDSGGRFTLNGLAPQTYTISIFALGYFDHEKKVEVKPGEVSNAIFNMRHLPIDESYTLTIPRTFLLIADHDYIQHGLSAGGVNQSTIDGLRCSPCWHIIHIERNATQAITEAMWNEGPGVINTQAYLKYWKDWSAEKPFGTEACWATLVDDGAFAWEETQVKSIQNVDKLKIYIHGGFTTVSYQQKVQTFSSFSYKGNFTEGFSALPPK